MPDLRVGEGALGRQRSSLRPTSASYSIARGARGCHAEEQEVPGPASYSKVPLFCTGVPSAVIGDAPKLGGIAKPYLYPDVDGLGVIDAASVLPAAGRPVIGREKRGGKITNPDLIRLCPEASYGHEGPGPKYKPKFRSASCGVNILTGRRQRPASAPSIPRSERRAPNLDEFPEVGPSSYKLEESGFGLQLDSRHPSSRSSSFGRSGRFAPQRLAQGELAAECAPAASTVGRDEPGRNRMRRPPSATFGFSTRGGAARALFDRPRTAAFGHPLRLPHPTVAPHKEVVMWGCAC